MSKNDIHHELIECAYCEAKVSAIVLSSREYLPSENDEYEPTMIYFLECPVCNNVMIGESELILMSFDDVAYEDPKRVWPDPKNNLHLSIPVMVRKSIDEAKKCYKAKAYSACAVMCGRSIEAIGKELGSKFKLLAKQLRELKDKKIIDGRLFEWGEALRDRRNIGAHASDEDISKEDARDVLDFTIAICEYVFVLSEKYKKFKEREAKRKTHK